MAVLLSARNEFRLHVVQLVTQFLTHRLTQGIGLTTGEVRQQTRQKHDLLLVDRNTVGILQILLHDGDVILDGLASPLTVDEVGDIIHRTRTVEGIHGNQILESARLQLTQIFLHTGRFKLERTDGAAVAIEFIGSRVGNGYLVDVEFQAAVQTYIGNGFLNDGQGFQSEEVHLDKSRIFDDGTFVLGNEHLLARLLIIRRADGYPIRDVVTANNSTAGMHTRTAYITFQHLGIFHRIAHQGIGRSLRSLQFGHVGNGIGQVEFLVGNLIRHELAQTVRFAQRQFLHARHVLDGHLGRHRAICNDVRHLLLPVLLRHPAEHFSTPVIIEVHIDIRQRDTVGIQETLEQKVVLNRVYFRDAQAIGHRRAGSRTTSRSYRNAQLCAGGIDKVLHNQEVSRETHRLHDVQLKDQTFLHLVGQGITVQFFSTVECQFCQIVGFQLDTVQLVVAPQTLYLGIGGILIQHHLAVFILGKLIK